MPKYAIWETVKFVMRTAFLVGVPATLAAIAELKPEWGAVIGVILLIIDKLIHEAPNKSNGLLPF